MRLIIEVHSGPMQGRKFILRAGQAMRFGRTEEADAVLHLDDEMSGLHFCVETTGSRCILRDLESTNGTRLNNAFVKEATLGHRDLITAGGTEFVVNLEGGGQESEETGGHNTRVVVDKSRIALEASQPHPSFGVEICDSGLTLVTGAMFGEPDEPASISDVVGPLSKRLPQFALVDFRKAAQPLPKELVEGVPLFDWLPAEIAASNSPLIIPPTAALDIASLLNDVWDNDAVVVLYSERDPDSVIAHLRRATRLNLDGSLPEKANTRGMLGYCWPSVLAPLLAFRSAEFVNVLLSGIDAMLIEMPDLPGTWQVYSRNNFPDILLAMGFRLRRDEELPADVLTTKDQPSDAVS